MLWQFKDWCFYSSERIFVFFCQAPEGATSPGPRWNFDSCTPTYQVTLSEYKEIVLPGALSLVAADFNSCPSSLLVCGKGSSISTLPKAPGTKAGIGGMGDGVGSS